MIRKRWAVAAMLGLAAAVLFFASTASFAFPGESARLLACWKGLETASSVDYPLMAVVVRLLGCGNYIAPICGALAVLLLAGLVAGFIAWRIPDHDDADPDERIPRQRERLSLIAALGTAVVFVLTPAVRSAATHLEPRLFDFTVALAVFAAALPVLWFRLPAWLYTLFAGVLVALGFCDSALFLCLLPFFLATVAFVARRRGRNLAVHGILFVVFFVIALLVALRVFGIDFTDFRTDVFRELGMMRRLTGWVFVAVFATVPFVLVLFASARSFVHETTPAQWVFHLAMTVAAIVAIATPLSPSELMKTYGVLPVVTSAYAACVAGYLLAYWWFMRRRAVAIIAGCALVFALAVTCVWNLCVFDGDRGDFADRVAAKIIKDLGERSWFVSDGVLDDHLKLVAAETGKKLHIISLARDADEQYLKALARVVEEENVGGSKNAELRMSLELGVLSFLQDWLAADPTVASEMAIFGAPDIWYGAGLTPVPEFFFFGADAKRVPDWEAWKEFDNILEAPKGWGSYRDRKEPDPVARLRFSLRRHLGFVANNRGVWLQDQKRDDEAWRMYELVLNEIDHDNICAVFNEVGMIGAQHPSAVAKRRDLERMLKAAVDDTGRRYLLWRLGTYYGYIRNPDTFIRLGHAWAKSGRPGDALAQIRRAIDFIPTDRRSSLMNMMAALYANENDAKKSRELYASVLEKNANDHDALLGLMRLELQDGNGEKALKYLKRASEQAGADKRQATIELGMLAMMKNDLAGAKAQFKKAIDADAKNLQAWSMLAAVTMQQIDAEKDAARQKALQKELESDILPTMERQSRDANDYYLQATRGFVLMRKGDVEKRRQAREAFVKAARTRPDAAVAHDMVLGLDISLDDKEGALRHAKDVLRRNRNAPLANYVMGSLALGRGEYAAAEVYLRKAADAPQPVPLALNDLAEVLRRLKNFADAERYARQAVKAAPRLYVAWETLGSILMDAKGDLGEAESAIRKACDLSKGGNAKGEVDVRMLVSLARVQRLNGDLQRAKITIRQVEARLGELSDFEKREFEEFKKGAR